MNLEIVNALVREILNENETFDSHVFIRKFIKEQTRAYGKMLETYDDVATAHREIGKFLQNNSEYLGIEKIRESISRDVFDNDVPCAEWRAISK